LTTDGTGQVVFAYAGVPLVGVDQIQASALVNGAVIYSNVVSAPWNNGTNQAPVVSAGQPQTIMLPAQAVLSGTVTDDGLPDNTLTITWSMLTGPGHGHVRRRESSGDGGEFHIAGHLCAAIECLRRRTHHQLHRGHHGKCEYERDLGLDSIIGIFDATLLANGGYEIVLNATNSSSWCSVLT
jgi:hypothetical protein